MHGSHFIQVRRRGSKWHRYTHTLFVIVDTLCGFITSKNASTAASTFDNYSIYIMLKFNMSITTCCSSNGGRLCLRIRRIGPASYPWMYARKFHPSGEGVHVSKGVSALYTATMSGSTSDY